MRYLKSLHWKYLIIMAILVIIAAIMNNVLQPAQHQVSWIGGQEILPSPEAQ